MSLDNPTKQELGRRFAFYLGFEPGPRGPDDGVDGWFEHNGRRHHFQSKLSGQTLGKDEARLYYSDIKTHHVDVSVMLAGVGYKQTFRERLFGHDDLASVRIHLLSLNDLFDQTPVFSDAATDTPALARLADLDWNSYK